MRHLVLALMIVLLPLRGWAGDVMATEMASASFAIDKVATSAHETGARGLFDHQNWTTEAEKTVPDCHEQLATQTETNNAATTDHCGTCQACQVCHTVGLSPSPLSLTASFSPRQLRPTRAAEFTSAATALGQKPPIS
jgi:hypothetical protein